MTQQIGIRVSDENGVVLGTLWQDLDEAETEANLTEDHQGSLGYILSDWSGEWEPERPDMPMIAEYDIVRRAA